MISNRNIEDAVKSGNFVIHSHGVSMWPMIRNGIDSVHIEPVSGRLNKFDIPLYKDNRGRYVIHRVIKVTDTGYVILGDGLYEREYDITDANVLGKVTGFFRKEKYISCESKGYLRYVKFWAGTILFMRKPIIWTVRKYRRGKSLMKDYWLRIKNGKGHYKKEQDTKNKKVDEK